MSIYDYEGVGDKTNTEEISEQWQVCYSLDDTFHEKSSNSHQNIYLAIARKGIREK